MLKSLCQQHGVAHKLLHAKLSALVHRGMQKIIHHHLGHFHRVSWWQFVSEPYATKLHMRAFLIKA